MATYREKRSIRRVIESFFETGFVDEIVVVNNNAEPGTDEEVKKTKAKLVHEPRQGYGYAFARAMLEGTGDYVVVSEPDGTFLGHDLERFVVYAKDFDVVLGTRTSQIGSLSGVGMGLVRKFANVIEAKTIEVLFNTFALTDVGCAYKLFKRKTLSKLSPLWSIKKTALFNTELVLLTVSQRLRFVEIPITYKKRVGVSTVVGKWYQVVKWAVVIQLYILGFWLRWILAQMVKNIRGKTAFTQ